MSGVGKDLERKRKFALWIRESTVERARELYEEDNCKSMSEFMEKAILFYAGYLTSEKSKSYLSKVITSTLRNMLAESDNRQNRIIFKLAVEQAMIMNILASLQGIEQETLERLRGECVKEVKRLNGNFSFEDAYDWQKG